MIQQKIKRVKLFRVFRMFIFLLSFRTSGKKGNLDENDFRHCYGNFFRKWPSEIYSITTMFKGPSQQYTFPDHMVRVSTFSTGHVHKASSTKLVLLLICTNTFRFTFFILDLQ